MAGCDVEDCGRDACVHFTVVDDHGGARYRALCDLHSEPFLAECLGRSSSAETAIADGTAALRLITYDERTSASALYLDSPGWRSPLRIDSGVQEAWFLDGVARRHPQPRPLTHQAFVNTISALGFEMVEVTVDDLEVSTNVFFAKLVLIARQSKSQIVVDLRPSDAIALALVSGAPITVSAAVLEKTERRGSRPQGGQN